MPNPDYPDWRDTEPPKEEKRHKPQPIFQQENKEKKGYAPLAADTIREKRAKDKKALDDVMKDL